jgi:predicted SprT family Zn-dependent metalloprotease
MDLKILSDTAAKLFAEHRLNGWSFGWSASKRRLGVCKYHRKRIEIGAYYAQYNAEAAVLDTLLHEIAHALAGPEAGHGPVWQSIALRIGATPKACDDSPNTIVEPGDWQVTCLACNRTHHRYKRPRSLSGYRCKCPAQTPLVYAYVGDPAHEPTIPIVAEPPQARWHANCVGCGIIHQRARRPKAGVWRCRCPARSELHWKFGPGKPVAD